MNGLIARSASYVFRAVVRVLERCLPFKKKMHTHIQYFEINIICVFRVKRFDYFSKEEICKSAIRDWHTDVNVIYHNIRKLTECKNFVLGVWHLPPCLHICMPMHFGGCLFIHSFATPLLRPFYYQHTTIMFVVFCAIPFIGRTSFSTWSSGWYWKKIKYLTEHISMG